MIYRDLEARPIGMQIADFVGKQDLHIITSFLSGVHAIRNRDTCEDVTGGLEVSKLFMLFGRLDSEQASYVS